jgi:hypothetical protein
MHIANEPNVLQQLADLLWTLLLPVRMLFWKMCCEVEKQKVQAAVIKDYDDEDVDEEVRTLY